MPPASHTDRATERELPTDLSIRPGTKNIPEPITVPMISSTRSCNRNTRPSARPAGKLTGLGAVSEEMTMDSGTGKSVLFRSKQIALSIEKQQMMSAIDFMHYVVYRLYC